MPPEADHNSREILETIYGLREILVDSLRETRGFEIRLVRLEERFRSHGRLIGALGAALAVIASALSILAD